MEKYRCRLRDLREDRDLRQTDVSKVTGIDQRTLSNYETGKTLPDSSALIRLANFFNVSIDYLVGRVDINVTSRNDIKKQLDSIYATLDDIKKML